MRCSAQFATIGHLTVGPAPDVQGRVDFCVERESARQTDKLVLGLPVTLCRISAGRTLSTGVARIDRKQGNPSARCFVRQKEAQLVEGPASQNCTLLFPNRYSIVNPGQFLDRDSTMSAFGFGNDLLRNAMVHVGGKTKLSATQSLKLALGAARAARLQLGPQTAVAVAHVVDPAARQGRVVRGRSNRLDSQIDAKKILHGLRGRVWYIAGGGQVELAAAENQVGFTLLRFQKFFLTFSSRVCDLDSSIDGPDAGHIRLVGEDARVVPNGSVLGKPPLGFLVELVGICDLGKHAYDDLSAQRKPLAGRMVKQFMQGVLAENFALPRSFADPVATCVCPFNRIEQRLTLVGICVQSDFSGQFQSCSLPQRQIQSNGYSAIAEKPLPPRSEDRSIRGLKV
jgi:hypothetical protein